MGEKENVPGDVIVIKEFLFREMTARCGWDTDLGAVQWDPERLIARIMEMGDFRDMQRAPSISVRTTCARCCKTPHRGRSAHGPGSIGTFALASRITTTCRRCQCAGLVRCRTQWVMQRWEPENP